jgi:CubicO group peptidase (beta-lactamase class C family)
MDRVQFCCALTLLGGIVAHAGSAKAVPGVATVAPQSDALRSVRIGLEKAIAGGEFPSLAIGVARGDAVLWLEALGVSDREAKLGATPDTKYAIASVSKSITGTLVAILAERGKLGWDDEIVRRVKGVAPGVTLSHLVEQTSGIPHLWWYEFAAQPASPLRGEQIISAARATAFPPGTGFLYSNLNFELAARYVEAVVGQPFATVARRELWAPLDMEHTTDDAWVGQSSAAAGYRPAAERVPFIYRLEPRGGAGLFSSARDLLRFAQFHLGGLSSARSLLSSTTLARIHGDGTPAGRRGYSHGWGRIEFGINDVALISDGELLGGTAAVVLLPKHQLAVVLLTNTNHDLLETAMTVVEAIEPGLAKSFQQGAERLAARWSTAGALPSGTFAGALELEGSSLTLRLDFDAKPNPTLTFGKGSLRVLDHLEWDRGLLEANVAADLPLPSDAGRSHELDLVLSVNGATIEGFATDALENDREGHHFGIPYPLHLIRTPH